MSYEPKADQNMSAAEIIGKYQRKRKNFHCKGKSNPSTAIKMRSKRKKKQRSLLQECLPVIGKYGKEIILEPWREVYVLYFILTF